MPVTKSSNALILSGAVARGAFEAGVLEVLSQKRTSFGRLVEPRRRR